MKRSKNIDRVPSVREQADRSPIYLKERGSVEWCYQKVAYLKDVFQMEQMTIKQWEDAINDLKEFQAWEKIPEGCPYGSLDVLLQTEIGIESEEDGRKSVIAKAAAETNGSVLRKGRRSKIHDSCIKPQKERARANGISYQTQQKLDRLAREFPEMCRLVADGQLTVAAAERAAGIAPQRTPLKVVQSAWRKADAAERERIVQWVLHQIEEGGHGC